MNAVRLHMDWRSVMRGAKAEELRGAVSSLAQRFERAIDRRDLLIQARSPAWPGCLWHKRRMCRRARRSKRANKRAKPGTTCQIRSITL